MQLYKNGVIANPDYFFQLWVVMFAVQYLSLSHYELACRTQPVAL